MRKGGVMATALTMAAMATEMGLNTTDPEPKAPKAARDTSAGSDLSKKERQHRKIRNKLAKQSRRNNR